MEAQFSDLIGKTLADIRKHYDDYDDEADIDEVIFETTEGEIFRQYHNQHCCERVMVESIVGDLVDLIDTPILMAEESVSESDAPEKDESATWTFYKLRTIKGSVDIRWYGSSNGYYSERVDFEQVELFSSLPEGHIVRMLRKGMDIDEAREREQENKWFRERYTVDGKVRECSEPSF